MRTTIELPESVYRRSLLAAQEKGFSVEQFIASVLEREFEHDTAASAALKPVSLPLIRSSKPGSLDLSQFDFDDLLA